MPPSHITTHAFSIPCKIWIVICLNLIPCLFLSAQSVISLTVDDGLSQGYVASVACDEDGFVWMSTLNGLNRYDGYAFQTWFEQGSGLRSNFVVSLKNDRRGLLWICTTRGLQVMDRKTGQILSLDCLSGTEEKNGRVMFVDSRGRIWLALQNVIQCIELPDRWSSINDISKNARVTLTAETPSFGEIASLSEFGPDLLVNTFSGVYVFQVQQKRFVFQEGLPAEKAHMAWFDTVRQQLLVRYDQKLFVKEGSSIRSWPLGEPVWNHEYNIVHNGNKTYVLSRFKVYEWKNNTLLTLPHQIDAEIVSAGVDMFGKAWLGTNAKGARVVKPWQQVFSISLPGTSIGGLMYDRFHNQFWFPVRGNFVETDFLLVDQETNKLGRRLSEKKSLNLLFLPNGGFLSLQANDRLEQFGEDGLPVKGSTIQFPSGFFLGKARNLYRMAYSGKIAIIDHFGNLILLDPVSKKMQFRKFAKLLNDASGETKSMVDDKYGNLWICTASGLIKMADSDMEIISTSSTPGKKLSSEKVNDVFIDPSEPNILWIGTARGLDKLNILTGETIWYTRKDGLNDDFIYTIQAGRLGDLWLGTNRGLLCFNRNTKQVIQYTVADGLPASEFNTGMDWTAPDSSLYFGTVGGLIHFNPYKMPAHETSPEMRITSVEINGRPLQPDSATHEQLVSYTSRIILRPGQNNLAFRFTVMDFFNSEKYNCRYRLDGADNDWHYTWSNNLITYSNLHAGTYLFRVAAGDGLGGWANERSLEIVVLAPWWNRWWAWIIWTYLLVKAAWIAIRLRRRWARMYRQVEMERLEARYRKDLEENKNRMFINIAHEIRTPLTILLGLTEEVRSAAGVALESKTKLMQQSGQQLLNVVQQILDLSKLEEKRLELNLKYGDIGAFIRYVAEPFQTIFRSRDITFVLQAPEQPVFMSFDPQYVQPLVSNLLSNALKFTAQGGIISLRLSQDDSDHITMSVEDTGIGIAPEHLDRIFDRYYQVQDSGAESYGTGIGLTYVYELVKAMGGEISVKSLVGVGSVFTIVLPVGEREAETLQWKPADVHVSPSSDIGVGQNKSSVKPIVLVVEDNYEMAQFIHRCLAGDFRLLHASNGAEGLEKALAEVPDIIVTDVMMPEMDGFEFCAALKINPVTNHIPVVMLTARADDSDRISGLRGGADAYITKPFSREILLLHLRNFIALRNRMQAKLRTESGANGGAEDAPEDAFSRKVYEILAIHFSEPEFGVENIASLFNMSVSQFHRKVSALLGYAPGEMIRKYRLEQARKMLVHSSLLSISEIAYSAGFRDPNYFSQAFSRSFGMSPSQFRQAHENDSK